jgi:hypothetical protein
VRKRKSIPRPASLVVRSQLINAICLEPFQVRSLFLRKLIGFKPAWEMPYKEVPFSTLEKRGPRGSYKLKYGSARG